MKDNFNIGIVADWLVTFAGAEKVIKEILEVYPESSLYSVVDFLSDKDRALLKGKKATTTFIQNLPKANTRYQTYLPLMPIAIEQLDVSNKDIVISSSHAVSKGVITGPDQLHISYIHSPMRYAWDLQHQYLRESGLQKGLKSYIAKFILHKMRLWDCRTVNGVDHFVANSHFIARRIKKVYGRNASVIYPPVDTERFQFCDTKDSYFLTASRLVPYKKIDLIVEAFAHLPDERLIVIGDGPEMKKIKEKAGRNIEILGYQSDSVMQKHMERARAFIFAGEEDFGITLVEAQSAGTPVIAYGKGGALEIVRPIGVDRPTGLFFEEQTVESLLDAITRFKAIENKLNYYDCRENSLRFSIERFRTEILNFVETSWLEFKENKSVNY
ncbi:glycosyltransferase family 4 protein [Pluralibacter gergoviae]|uniref:glycosyltransferase family 4 protein n=1 Tax=Pluralibacter gergoviae TaxID=61647 RepID=UPI00190C478A|nr:glycosyltransferase family 4 protein [Pluralibacter gergoviae]EKT9643557.1 glycosyltransferase family 4 protein [Pluralibacter gergoviae]EMD1656844.1 glycosyltransferase family 4 protein [Pluralibacter gergoviae]MBK4118578.1 glycosyltransferase family 4 protein [Pluralibacter gergoviae]